MLLKELNDKGLINPPKWLPTNCCYLTLMGSVAYGCSSDTSDCDVYGFCIPPKDIVFPHLSGDINGFGKQKQRFDQWQKHHVEDASARKNYDFTVFSIVRYFHLCMENNPNALDSIFTPINCVLHSTEVGNLVRENRRMFLHKGAYHRFLGYSHSQLHKMESKFPEDGSKRAKLREEFGMDTKFAYHIVRLADECEQILTIGDIDLQRSKERMKAVRRGEVSAEEIKLWFAEKERTLEKLYAESKLQHSPDEGKIKQLLLNCLEHHYGNLEKCVVNPNAAIQALKEVQEVLDRNASLLR